MPMGVNDWHAGISKCRFPNIIRVNFIAPVTDMVLSVLGSLCYLYLFIWLSVFTAPILAVVPTLLHFPVQH